MAKIEHPFGTLFFKGSRLSYIQDADPIVYTNGQKKRMGYFLCECGTLIKTAIGDVKNGKSLSCGCLERELTSARFTTHGKSKRSEYNAWSDMIRRCYKETDKAYPNYGGRGIKVCGRWLDKEIGLSNFLEDMGDRPDKHSLDRIDTNGDYCPENCRWSDWSNQLYNRRRLPSNNSGVTGVCFDKQTSTWMAYIKKGGKTVNLGRYKCIEDAAQIRREAEIDMYGYTLDYHLTGD